MRVCLASSRGGHLTECLQLKPVLDKHEWFLVTEESVDSKGLAVETFFLPHFHNPVGNRGYHLIALLKNIAKALRIVWKKRPQVVISSGAAAVIPFCIIAKLFGAKLVFIECFNRVREPSFSGKIAYFFADKFFVQWKELLKCYGKKAEFKGALV